MIQTLASSAFAAAVALAAPAALAAVAAGQAAPNFTLTDIGGKPHSLSDFKGKSPVVLVFGNFT